MGWLLPRGWLPGQLLLRASVGAKRSLSLVQNQAASRGGEGGTESCLDTSSFSHGYFTPLPSREEARQVLMRALRGGSPPPYATGLSAGLSLRWFKALTLWWVASGNRVRHQPKQGPPPTLQGCCSLWEVPCLPGL